MSQPTVNVLDKSRPILGGVFPMLPVENLDSSLRYLPDPPGLRGAVAQR